jgi:hypothetical protein
MARRLSNGIQGKNVLGSIVAVNNSLRSVVDNANVILQPNGTGISVSVTDLQINSANSLRLADSDSSNHIALRAPGAVAANVTLTFPNTAGSSDQVLRTDGSGNLTWVAPFISVANQLADSATYYPTLTTATSGTVSTVNTSSTKLSYQPSSGRLTLSGGQASSSTSTGTLVVTGGVGIGGQMTAVSIVETSSITLKENITPIQNALESILQLRGVTYDRIDNNEHESGLIAEWTEEILLELVTRDADGNVVGIKYTKLTAYLIEAVKTLKQEFDELKNK